MRWDGRGGMWGGRSESEWVGIGRNRGFSDSVAWGWVLVVGVMLGFACAGMVGGRAGVVRVSRNGSE